MGQGSPAPSPFPAPCPIHLHTVPDTGLGRKRAGAGSGEAKGHQGLSAVPDQPHEAKRPVPQIPMSAGLVLAKKKGEHEPTLERGTRLAGREGVS